MILVFIGAFILIFVVIVFGFFAVLISAVKGSGRRTSSGPGRRADYSPADTFWDDVSKPKPEGLTSIATNSHVAGISHRSDMAIRFMSGKDQRLGLQREAANKYDPNAIMVLGYWTEHGGIQTAQLGYVPRDTAARIATKYSGEKLTALPKKFYFPEGKFKTPGIQFDILREKKSTAKPRRAKIADAEKPTAPTVSIVTSYPSPANAPNREPTNWIQKQLQYPAMDFIALDVETANASLASICQLGIAEFRDGKLTDEREWLIDPEEEFDGMNIHIHGIDEDAVRGQPTWQNIYPQLRDIIEGKIVVTYTAFDRSSLSQACQKYRFNSVECVWIDSAKMVRRVWLDLSEKGYGLSKVAKRLGIEFQHHKAREDARAAGLIAIQAVQQSGIPWSEWLTNFPKTKNDSGSIKRDGNPEGMLFGEVIAFTGSLTMVRGDAAALAASVGCSVEAGVTKHTTLLVVGDQDITKLTGNTKSSKHRKAEDLISKGQSIRILCETDFRALLSSERSRQ